MIEFPFIFLNTQINFKYIFYFSFLSTNCFTNVIKESFIKKYNIIIRIIYNKKFRSIVSSSRNLICNIKFHKFCFWIWLFLLLFSFLYEQK